MSCGDALIAGRRLAHAFIGGPVSHGSSAAWRVTAVRRVSRSRSNRTGGSDRGQRLGKVRSCLGRQARTVWGECRAPSSRGMHPMSGYACHWNLPSGLDQRRHVALACDLGLGRIGRIATLTEPWPKRRRRARYVIELTYRSTKGSLLDSLARGDRDGPARGCAREETSLCGDP
jgi:hypothetical protein